MTPLRLLSARLGLPVLPFLLLGLGCRHAPPSDESLAGAVQARIAGDAAISAEPIQTSVQSAVATLSGNVSSDAARSLAASDAAAVTGVRTVVNNLTVANAVNVPPANPQPLPRSTPAPQSNPKPNSRTPLSSRADRERAKPQPVRADTGQAPQTAAPTASEAQSQAANPPSSAPPAPAPSLPPPAPVVRNITVPAGTILPIRVTQTLDSATTQQGDSFSGSISSDVVVEGTTVLRQGTAVSGRVTVVQEAAHFKGNSLLTVELTGLTRRGDHLAVSTDPYSAEGKGRGKNTAEKVGGGAAVGAILGGIFGGGRGAGIGAAAGGGLGAGAQAVTKGQQVQIPAESLVRFRLSAPVTVRVAGSGDAPSPSANPAPSSAPDSSGSGDGRRPLSQ